MSPTTAIWPIVPYRDVARASSDLSRFDYLNGIDFSLATDLANLHRGADS